MLKVIVFLLLIGFCIGGESLKCYSCMFPNDSWCKDVANLKFQEEIITQQNCPDHVKNCGYTEIVDDEGNEMVFRTCGGELLMENKCEVFTSIGSKHSGTMKINTTVCYCGSSLCNSSKRTDSNLLFCVFSLILLVL